MLLYISPIFVDFLCMLTILVLKFQTSLKLIFSLGYWKSLLFFYFEFVSFINIALAQRLVVLNLDSAIHQIIIF